MSGSLVKEKRFYKTLEDIFVGAKIEGDSGFVNLLKIKEKYYSSVLECFKEDVNKCDLIVGSFREEFFDKLYNFFEKYFSESGSVYFVKTANWQKVYERVYTDNKDVVLFWKTHMLYYVKSDILFNSIDIEVKDEENNHSYNFYFDVGNLQSKQNNEKKKIIYEFREIVTHTYKDKSGDNKERDVFVFDVMYSTHGRITKLNEIVKDTNISDSILNKAFNTFEKQSEVDFFINKNAREFLIEQLDLYLHQILLKDENKFEQNRLNQIKTIKEFAIKIINFISQFEDELVRIWNKPKFVLNSEYVISLKTLKDYISSETYEIVNNFIKNELNCNEAFRDDITNVIKEIYKIPLQKIYLSDIEYSEDINLSYVKGFKSEEKRAGYLENNPEHKVYCEPIYDRGEEIDSKFATYDGNNIPTKISYDDLYLDTKFCPSNMKNMLLKEITDIVPLDDALNGYLIKSDNYQYLNTCNKFNNKVDLIYIDPPFNTEGSSYAYLDKFKDSTWLSMLNDRLELIKRKYIFDGSSFYMHLDHHGVHLGRLLSDNIFGELNREIVWNTSESISGLKAAAQNFIRQHDTILYYKGPKAPFNKMYDNYKEIKNDELGWLDMFEDEEKKAYIYKYMDENFLEKVYLENIPTMALGDVWNDVLSMMYTQNMTRENWSVDNTQKPENLLRRIIQASTNQGDIVMDFYVGTGTTISAAHKLNRKWVGIDTGDFIETTTLTRMKTVVMGDIRPKLSIDLNWQGGGFFKYYSMEQYEDTLRNMKYKEDQVSIFNDKKPFEEYIFFADNKLADVLEIEEDNIELNFDKLYKDIDWPETISNLYGLPIKKIYEKSFTLQDGEDELIIDIDFVNMSSEEKVGFVQKIKPLLWWRE